MVSLPDVAFVPDHAPDAVHDVVLVEFHTSTEETPCVTFAGFALIETVGGFICVTEMVVLSAAEPRGPVQLMI